MINVTENQNETFRAACVAAIDKVANEMFGPDPLRPVFKREFFKDGDLPEFFALLDRITRRDIGDPYQV